MLSEIILAAQQGLARPSLLRPILAYYGPLSSRLLTGQADPTSFCLLFGLRLFTLDLSCNLTHGTNPLLLVFGAYQSPTNEV